MKKNNKNILNEPFRTKYETAPFSSIKTEDFIPAIKHHIAKTKEEIEQITSDPSAPDFTNTIEALEYSGAQLDRITSVFFNLNSAETNEEIQKAAQEISPLLTEFANDVILNEALFKRIKSIYDQRESLNLSAEQSMLLERKYKNFARNGANLPDDKKDSLRKIDRELATLSLKFGENVLAETNKYTLHIENKEQLGGLPESTLEAAAEEAAKREKKGYVFTLNYPSYIPFMTYAENRTLRKQLYIAFGSKCSKGDALDNTEIIQKIIGLRKDRAELLGYASHADFVLEERMAEAPSKVSDFLEDLLEKATPAARTEFQQLEEFARKTDGIDRLEKWDSAYYQEKLKQKLFDVDDEKLKPYFQLEKVIHGIFIIANRLYDLNFKEVHDIDTYHEEVKTYEVTNSKQELVSIFYADFHPREGKRNGAWMTSYKPQYHKDNKDSRPHISIVCNFTRPTATKPSLLTFNEVTTLFHEFGHALHGMLAATTYPSLSGTNVYWDFVELPSQVFENWCYEKEALELFARHYKTGEIIPAVFIEKIKKSSNFMEGLQTLRQLSFGLLDISYHTGSSQEIKDIKSHEKAVFKATDLFPETPDTCMSTSFSHIFQGGYSSGYYSYKWAEVLDADAFELFKEKGIFNKEVSLAFMDHILSRGGTENPMDLYIRFRGKEPQPEALLKRAGLLN